MTAAMMMTLSKVMATSLSLDLNLEMMMMTIGSEILIESIQ